MSTMPNLKGATEVSAALTTEAPPQANAHVVDYLRHHAHLARQRLMAADDMRRLEVGKSAAERYDQAAKAAPARVGAITAGQAQPIEPVRFKRDVEPGSWIDPEQRNKFSKTPEKVNGFRRVDEMVRLQRRGTLSLEHLAAGMKLRDDFEISEGAKVGMDLTMVRSGAATAGVPHVQLDAIARYRNAISAVGPTQSGIVITVVLENRTVTAWAEKRGMSLTRATGYLEGAMDRLKDHYKQTMTLSDIHRARDA